MADLFGTLAMYLLAALPFVLLILVFPTEQRADLGSVGLAGWWRHLTDRPTRQTGTSFQDKLRAASLPSAVRSLAEAYAAGEDCGFALHDALLEAGQAELAEPFRRGDPIQQLAAVERILEK